MGLYRFGVITHGDFFVKEGVNIGSVMTATADGYSKPIMEMVAEGTYAKAILFFGTNELGWPSYNSFINKYGKLVDKILELQPGCKVFIVGVPPVSKRVSETSTTGITIENVRRINQRLIAFAEARGLVYVTVPDALFDEEGYLPSGASSDGIHFNLTYDRIWADHIARTVRENS